jgi:UDP:flavonoid glycosyltransferase YjiC (YdhE family)
MNSVSESIVYGVPMLVSPQAADQFLVARRVEELGLGRRLRRGDHSPERLRELGRTVIADTGMKEELREHGQLLRVAGGVQRAADVLLRHLGGRGGTTATAPFVTTASAG